jgi:hypothetical protein
MPKFFLILSVLCTMYFVLCTGKAFGQAVIESPNYKIQMPNLNSGAGIPTSDNFRLNTTMGQTAPGLFSSAGYRVKSGFQYIYSIIPFSFAVSGISVNFGTLLPQTPVTKTNTLLVSSGGAGGYQVKASEDGPMKVAGTTSTIPNTNCDAGCTNSAAGVWDTVSKYGFGYNMSGDDIPADFTDLTYYRPFADRSISESPQVIMSSVYVGRARQSTVTYKANISAVQPAGIYNNTIMYTAIPSY